MSLLGRSGRHNSGYRALRAPFPCGNALLATFGTGVLLALAGVVSGCNQSGLLSPLPDGGGCDQACPAPLVCADGECVAPSCAGLPSTCGPSMDESCCSSPAVHGDTFFRLYDNI